MRIGRRRLVAGGCAALALMAVSGLRVSGQQTAAPADHAVTFNKDVAPILFAHCASCHRDGEIGPMPLTSYAEARPWARAIQREVESKAMPPWLADPQYGEFANDPRLSANEISTIARWAGGSAAEGARADLPALLPLATGWRMGTPDIVLTPDGPFAIAANPRSVYGDLPIPTHFDRDQYVQTAEVRPGNPEVTHHANLMLTDAHGVTNRVASYSPGAGAKSYPPGVAKLIPKGATLNLNLHFNPRGAASVDPGTAIGLVFARDPVRQIAMTAESGTNVIDIAPGDANYERVGKPFVFQQDSHILTVMPRMNERGKDFRYTLVYPDGTSIIVLSIPAWNHGWVFTYALKEPIAAPKGSRLETVAHWDNSARNKRNPDPAVRVPFGPEIMNGYFEYVIDSQDLRHTSNQLGR